MKPVKITYEGWSTISPTRENNDILVPYLPPGKIAEEFTTQFAPRKPKKPATGWCSWYAFGRNITEEKIIANPVMITDKKPFLAKIKAQNLRAKEKTAKAIMQLLLP